METLLIKNCTMELPPGINVPPLIPVGVKRSPKASMGTNLG